MPVALISPVSVLKSRQPGSWHGTRQDWVSSMEGGTVYRSDSWGTQNTTTGQYWEGQPFDYVHFTGQNLNYNEGMTPVNSRELWERHVR